MLSVGERCPPCIVLGLETQIGLNLVRELGRGGVPVIGIATNRHAIGLASRYLTRGIVVSQPRSPELLACIRSLGEEYGECCLMAISEVNMKWLAAQTDFGTVKRILPPPVSLATVLDKQKTLKVAEGLGLDIPHTFEAESLQEIESIGRRLRFPAVLKWKDPEAVASQLDAQGLEMLKAEYVYTPAELMQVAARYAPLGQWPLIQEYCSGIGLGQLFYMHGGLAIRRFQHLRIAEWPPEGGVSSVCDAIALSEHQALQEKSIALLRAIGWEGVAMVEYRYNPLTGCAMLMEINGRYWGSFPLSVHCGAGFGLLAHHLNSGLGMPRLRPIKQGIRCRMVGTELKRLVRIWAQPGKIADRSFAIRPMKELWRFVSDFVRPGVRYYVWSLHDPGPFCADVRNVLLKPFRTG